MTATNYKGLTIQQLAAAGFVSGSVAGNAVSASYAVTASFASTVGTVGNATSASYATKAANGTNNFLVSGNALIGAGGQLRLQQEDLVYEGGQILFDGSTGYVSWFNDVYQNRIRWYESGLERFRIWQGGQIDVPYGPLILISDTGGTKQLRVSGSFQVSAAQVSGSDQSSRFALNYPLTLQGYQDNNAAASIWHNAYATYNTGGAAVIKWGNTHGSFGSRGIGFDYIDGIHFYADNVATTADTPFTPTERFYVGNDGTIRIAISSSLYVGGHRILSSDGYTRLGASTLAGGFYRAGISIGDGQNDPANYYDGTAHAFRDASGSNTNVVIYPTGNARLVVSGAVRLPFFDNGTVSQSATVNWANGANQMITLAYSAYTTLSFSNAEDGMTLYLQVFNDNGGARKIGKWDSGTNVKFAETGSFPPTGSYATTAAGMTDISFIYNQRKGIYYAAQRGIKY